MSFRFHHGDRPLEGYTILRGVGRGGFGEVYFAVSDGGRHVALKWIGQYADVELRGVAQCINLKSPHLISIFDVRRAQDGTPYVIMEYVAGPSLRDLLRAEPSGMPAPRAAYFLREIGKGLSYLHDQGIVHRDLKPENIFYEDGFVKIGDYGLSKYISLSQQSGHTLSVGTVHYMAPEIGSGKYDRGIDIYALGIIFYELLRGEVPYTGATFAEILMKHLTAKPDLEGIDPISARVIERALAKKPEERYPTVQAMVEDLYSDPRVEAAVASFDARTIASVPGPRTIGAEEAQRLAAEVTRPQIDAKPAPPRPEPPPAPARPGPPPVRPLAARLEQVRGRIDAAAHRVGSRILGPERGMPRPIAGAVHALREREEGFGIRLLIAAATIAAMALVLLTLSNSRREETFFVTGWAMSLAAIGIYIVERFLVPRYRLEWGLARRLLATGAAAPGLLFLQEVPVFERGRGMEIVFAALASVFLIQWSERLDPMRSERVSLGQGLMAAIVGGIAGAILDANVWIGAGIMAGLSLSLNALAPFRIRVSRAARAAAVPAPGPAPAAMPVRPLPAIPNGRAPANGSAPQAEMQTQSTAVRIGWLVLGLALLTWGLGVGAMVMTHRGGDHAKFPIAMSFVTFLSAFGAVAVYKSLVRRKRPFVRGTVMPFGLSACLALGVSGVLWLAGPGPDAMHRIGLFALFASAIGASFLVPIYARARRAERGLPDSAPRIRLGAGWTALGWLVFVIASVVILAGGLFGTGLGDILLREAQIRPPVDLQGLARSHVLSLIGIVIALPALIFYLLGRRAYGGAHMLRGAAGLVAAGVLFVCVAQILLEEVRIDGAFNVQFRSADPGSLLVMGLLAAGAAILIAWPAARRPTPAPVEAPAPAGADPDPGAGPAGPSRKSSVIFAALSSAPALAEVASQIVRRGSGWGG
ncbi:MAG: serine/threonine protein kinase [Planctomycetes bacterium]|nr:serine/threonine protein kinase [Planctomycetota bacterium]